MVEKFDIEATKEILKDKLGSLYEKAEEILKNYGKRLSFDVVNVLMYAADQGEEKIKEAFDLLEKHYSEHLYFQHPDVRGTIYDLFGVNKTQAMFLDICEGVLELKPS